MGSHFEPELAHCRPARFVTVMFTGLDMGKSFYHKNRVRQRMQPLKKTPAFLPV